MNLHELTDILTSEMKFEFDQTKKIGHMRCQYGDNKLIANQFVQMKDIATKVESYNLDLKRINEIVKCIQFDLIKNYDMLLNYCKGNSNKEETNYFLQDNNVNYWIRLNPLNGTSDYNCYIHIYHE